MKITVQSSKAVKPAYGSCGIAPASTADAVPLTVLDKANFDLYISSIFAFRPPARSSTALEAGLAKALVDYREWAGRLGVDARGNRAILLNDAGVRFVEATADVELDSVMPLEPTRELGSLYPSGGDDDGPEELMLIQVTRFPCGSLVVGSTTHHVVSDGHAANNFFRAWCQATRGAAVDPVPVHDRASFFRPRDPPRVEYEHRGVEFKTHEAGKVDTGHAGDEEVVITKVHLSREFMSELKSQASAGGQRPYSTLKCVVAHLWRCITKARGLDHGTATSARIAVDGRARMSPKVPEGYTGNVVLWAWPTTTAGELVTRPLRHAVELIHREVARIDDGYFKSFIDFANSGAVEKERLTVTADATENILSPNIEVDSILGMFDDLDFGAGRPFFFVPGYLPQEGLVFITPSFFGDGGMDAYVGLFSRDVDTFKNCCYEKHTLAGKSGVTKLCSSL